MTVFSLRRFAMPAALLLLFASSALAEPPAVDYRPGL